MYLVTSLTNYRLYIIYFLLRQSGLFVVVFYFNFKGGHAYYNTINKTQNTR